MNRSTAQGASVLVLSPADFVQRLAIARTPSSALRFSPFPTPHSAGSLSYVARTKASVRAMRELYSSEFGGAHLLKPHGGSSVSP
jgi:hypothetical protein